MGKPTDRGAERRPTPVAGSPLAPLLVTALPLAPVLPRLFRTTRRRSGFLGFFLMAI